MFSKLRHFRYLKVNLKFYGHKIKSKNLSTYEIKRNWAEAKNGSNLSTKRVNIQPGKESPCCWTKTASKNSICSSHTGVIISAWKRQNSSETELLPDKERSTDVSYLYLHRILPYSEEHFQKCWLRRSAKSWTKR